MFSDITHVTLFCQLLGSAVCLILGSILYIVWSASAFWDVLLVSRLGWVWSHSSLSKFYFCGLYDDEEKSSWYDRVVSEVENAAVCCNVDHLHITISVGIIQRFETYSAAEHSLNIVWLLSSTDLSGIWALAVPMLSCSVSNSANSSLFSTIKSPIIHQHHFLIFLLPKPTLISPWMWV